MSFVSQGFLLFLAIVFLAYYIVPLRFRWIVLLVSSYAFYALNDVRAFFFIVLTTCTVFCSGIAIDKINAEQKALLDSKDEKWLSDNKKSAREGFGIKRKRVVVFALLVNFCILALLKYSGFFVESLNAILPKLSVSAEIPYLNLLIPLGLSFYTFQSLGYIVDVYRGKYPADRNLARFALFVSFFPQIVQGPISRYDQLAHQLTEGHAFDYENFKYGLQLILWGLFKKLVIADRAAIPAYLVLTNSDQYEGSQIGFAVLLFTIRVYTDFSGGMDIARGVSKCLGIDMVRNFQRPYFAISISDYWRRWHITLGAWMRDYLLYSITFSKGFAKLNKWSRTHLGSYFGKILPTCLAMTVVFFAVGVWHGAGWMYIAFGFYNGALIVIGILLTAPIQKMRNRYPAINTKKPFVRIGAVLGTFFLVCIGKYFAAAYGLRHALDLLYSTFSAFNPGGLSAGFLSSIELDSKELVVLIVSITMLFIVSLIQERGINIRECFARQNIVLKWLAYCFVVLCILLLSDFGEGIGVFVYQQF